MKIVQNLRRVNKYLREFQIDGIRPLIVTSQGDAVTKLAFASGYQMLTARPEMAADGDSDVISGHITLAFFLLAKLNGPASTVEKEEETFDRLEDLAEKILDRLVSDITEGNCPLLCGLDLRSVDIVPESSLFGGWSGYSIEISLW